jgi:hypothetical protein
VYPSQVQADNEALHKDLLVAGDSLEKLLIQREELTNSASDAVYDKIETEMRKTKVCLVLR